MDLDVLTWNLAGAPPEFASELEEDMRAAAAAILAMDPLPDVLAFQEVFFPANLRHLGEALSAAYEPVVPDEARTKPGVPWPLLLVPPLLLTPLAILWRLRQGGLVSFARRGSPWSVVSTRFDQYRDEAPTSRLLEGDGYGDKGVQTTLLRHARTGRELVLLNTHLQKGYRLDQRLYEEVRIRQLRQLRGMAEAERGRRPVLAVGDLNTTAEDAAVYREIEGFWQDLTRHRGRRPTRGTARGKGRWIDYVLGRGTADAAFSVREVGIVAELRRKHISDHRGLYTRLALGPAAARLPVAPLALGVLAGPSTRRSWLAAALALGAEAMLRPFTR